MAIPEKYNSLLNCCLDSLKNCVDLTAKYEIANDGTLESLAKEYYEIDCNIRKQSKAFNKVEEALRDNGERVDIEKMYKELVPQQKINGTFADSQIYQSVFGVNDDIEEVQQKKPNTSKAVFKQVNDSVAYAEEFKPPVDPISKTVITDPYQNRYCGHVFEHNIIVEYIKTSFSSKGKCRCPYVGCTNTDFTEKDLRADPKLKKKVEEYLENHESSEEEEDDDE